MADVLVKKSIAEAVMTPDIIHVPGYPGSPGTPAYSYQVLALEEIVVQAQVIQGGAADNSGP